MAGCWVADEDLAAEAAHDLGEADADFAGSEDADGFAEEVDSEEAIDLEVSFADAVVCAVGFAVEGEEHGYGVLCDGVGGVGWDAGY